ncbi:unnamed protein product [Prunus armeniaca]
MHQQKNEVNLAMHQQEVPLVNIFLEGVKSDPERAQKTSLMSAYAFGEMYVNLKAALAKEVDELKQKKTKEIDATRVEAVESFRTSEELKNYILDRLVDEQIY